MPEGILFFAALNLAGLAFVCIYPMRDKVGLSGIMTALYLGFAPVFLGVLWYEQHTEKHSRLRCLPRY